MARLRRASSRAGRRPAKLGRRFFEDWLDQPRDRVLGFTPESGHRSRLEWSAYWNRLGAHLIWASNVEAATGVRPSYPLVPLTWKGKPPSGPPCDSDIIAVMLVRPEPSPRPAAVVIPLRR
ncbi:MAG: hypothetical protein WCP28_07165 [Actinomycetes bacterium]